MLRKRLPYSCAASFLMFIAAESNAAGGSVTDSIPVQFAVLFEEGASLSGTATCFAGKECKILENEELKVGLTVELTPMDGELSLRCAPADCSFSNGKSKIKIEKQRQFDFYRGVDGIEVPLVLVPRIKLGHILLHYP